MSDGGSLVPRQFETTILSFLGLGEVVNGRYYVHDFASVPVGWAEGGSGKNADQVIVHTQRAFLMFSRELLEDTQPSRRVTWAEHAAREFERKRLRNRIRRIPAWWWQWKQDARRAIAHRIYPFEEG